MPVTLKDLAARAHVHPSTVSRVANNDPGLRIAATTRTRIETLLRELNLRTGRFTSPHLESMNERITLDGAPIPLRRFVEVYEDIRPYVDIVDASQEFPMSFFEVITGMAFAAFADALAQAGLNVVMVDSRGPAKGSTPAKEGGLRRFFVSPLRAGH